MKRLHVASGIVIMVFAALFTYWASKMSFGTLRRPGPAFLPFGYGILLFLITAAFVSKTGLKKRPAGDSAGAPWQNVTWQRAVNVLAVLIGYALLLERLGYPFCTWVLMTLLFWGKGARRRSLAIAGGLLVSAASYILFKNLLMVRLPSGWFGI